jgi:3-oxoacyl-[acyl-carrier protein] reductase
MELGIAGRTALVCASTSGLGLASARALAAEGVRTVICGRRGDLAQREAAALPEAIGVEIDLERPDAARRLAEASAAAFGPVDILVLNSAGPPAGTAAEQDRDSLLAAVRRLLLPHDDLIRQCLPAMLERGWGRIIAIGSSGITEPIPGLALSNVARSGLAGLLKTLAAEVADRGVTVNMVIPGRIATERLAALDQWWAEQEGRTTAEQQARSRATIPARRYGTPEEFGAAVAFLAGQPASYVTGSLLRVDGGLARGY